MASVPDTLENLVALGWERAEQQLAAAAGELELVTHWFVTPEDSSVNADEHFGSDARTARFVGVVVPTLIEQLGASVVSVSVPWGLEEATPLLVLVAVLPGAAAAIEARPLTRLAGAGDAPWWVLGERLIAPPSELSEIAAQLRL